MRSFLLLSAFIFVQHSAFANVYTHPDLNSDTFYFCENNEQDIRTLWDSKKSICVETRSRVRGAGGGTIIAPGGRIYDSGREPFTIDRIDTTKEEFLLGDMGDVQLRDNDTWVNNYYASALSAEDLKKLSKYSTFTIHHLSFGPSIVKGQYMTLTTNRKNSFIVALDYRHSSGLATHTMYIYGSYNDQTGEPYFSLYSVFEGDKDPARYAFLREQDDKRISVVKTVLQQHFKDLIAETPLFSKLPPAPDSAREKSILKLVSSVVSEKTGLDPAEQKSSLLRESIRVDDKLYFYGQSAEIFNRFLTNRLRTQTPDEESVGIDVPEIGRSRIISKKYIDCTLGMDLGCVEDVAIFKRNIVDKKDFLLRCSPKNAWWNRNSSLSSEIIPPEQKDLYANARVICWVWLLENSSL